MVTLFTRGDGQNLQFCFFKQKTAYEMRISNWSSDVCSSDLIYFPITITLILSSGRSPLSKPETDRYLYIAILNINDKPRSEERRVGKECVSTCRSRW